MSKILIDEETLYAVIDALNIGYLISSGKEQQMIFDVRHKLLDDLQGLLDELQETKKRFSVLEWHPVSEKPKIVSQIIVRFASGMYKLDIYGKILEGNMLDQFDQSSIVEWAYLPE